MVDEICLISGSDECGGGGGNSDIYERFENKGQINGYAALDGTARLPAAQLPLSALEYKGTWNASSNTPTLSNGSGNLGDIYRVSTAGNDLGFQVEVGDVIFYDGNAWYKLGSGSGSGGDYTLPVATATVLGGVKQGTGVTIAADGTLTATVNSTTLAGYQLKSEKGVNNGYASLDAAGKLPSAQLPLSALEYKGTWNAATNTPPLAAGVGTQGDMWRVTVTGTQFGVKFTAGDFALFNGTQWETATSGTAGVSTVAGLTGDVAAAPLKTALALDKVDNTADAAKNVLSATKLTTARTINGVAFDGTSDITVPVDQATDALYERVSSKGAPDGYAPLDSGSKVPAANLPSYVDDIVEAADLAAFPATGETGKIYVALDSGMTYRWSGSTYVAVSDKVTAAGITDSTVVGRELVTATDEAAARSALNIDTVMVEDFRDGVLTDNQIIEAAFAAVQPGGGIKFGQGVTYTITQDLIITPFLKDGVLVDGHGSTLSGAAGVGMVFSLRGEKFATTTTLTAPVASRSATLKVANTAGFVAGDMVALRSSGELFSPDYSTGVKQEMGRVAAVVDATTLLLDGRTWNTYSLGGNTVTVQRYAPIRNLKIRDLTVAGAGDGSGQHGLNVRHFDGLTLQNVTAKDCATTGLSAWEGINLSAVGCHAQDSVGFNGSQGYGFTTSEVNSVRWVGCYGTRNRHSFDAFGSRDVSIVACTAEHNSSSGISTHASTDVVKVLDCTVRECGGGIIVRGRNNTVRGNHILGTRTKFEQDPDDAFSYRSGIIIGQGGSSYDGLGGTNLIVDGNLIDLSGPDYTQNFESENSANSAIFVHAPLVNAQITNNYATGFPFSAIYNQADYNRNVLVAGNVFDCSAQTGTIKDGIFFAPRSDNAAPGNVNTDITVFGNTMSGAVRNGISIAGGSTVDVRSDRIRIYDNRIGVCGVAKVSLVDGYFGADVSVYDTAADSDAGLVFTAGNFAEPPYLGAANWYDSAARTMSGKTLVSPKVNEITNTAGGLALAFPDVPPLLKDDLGLDEDGKADPRAVSNHLQVFRSNGGSMYLSAAGDAENVPIAISCKGTGGIVFRTDNGTTIAAVQAVANAVNYPIFIPAITGQDPVLASTGETLVGLRIQNRGNATKFTTLLDKAGNTMARFGTVAGTTRGYLTFYPGDPNCRIVADVAGTAVNSSIGLEPAGTGVTTTGGVQVEVKGHTHTVAQVVGARSWATVPASADAPGTAGQEAYDADFHYICVTTGAAGAAAWKRTPLTTW